MSKFRLAAWAAALAIAGFGGVASHDTALANPSPDKAAAATTGNAADPAKPADPATAVVAPDAAPAPAAPASTPPPPPAHPVISVVREKLTAPDAGKKTDKTDREALGAFYSAYAGEPYFARDGKLMARANAIVAEIRKADDWGLKASDFTLPDELPASATPEQQAQAEIDVGLAALKYARYARGGRINPSQLTRMWDQEPDLVDPKDVLKAVTEASAPDDYLRSLHPKHPQFERLRKALQEARKPAHPTVAASSGEDPKVQVPAGPRLKPGDKHAQVEILRKRLGVAAESGQEKLFDAKLTEAVRAVQKANGIEPTGVVSKTTRAALNGETTDTDSQKIRRIVVNMERWRWLPANLGDMYVWDNIPEFTTRVMKDGASIFTEKIIVGTGQNPTPVFSANMQSVVFHPSWGVPDGIKSNEIGPALRRSSGDFFFFGSGASSVLKRHGLSVTHNGRPVDPDSVNWGSVDIRQFHFSQPPGSTNVLGVVKFMFPNKHDVYMHDTPQRDLFNSQVRMFSHGCVRVQNPRRFAEIILGHDKGWPPAEIGRLLGGGQNEVKLDKPIPVHITYFTAMVDDQGRMQTFGDAYGHDSRILSALEGRPVQYIAATETSAAEDGPPTAPAGKSNKRKQQSTGDTILESLFNGGSF